MGRELKQVTSAVAISTDATAPSRIEGLQYIVRDVAVFEFLGQVPTPQLGHRRVGSFEQVLDLV
mgnify:CR=1 FL=1